MYQFTKKQQRTLSNLGLSREGKNLQAILEDMKKTIIDVTKIDKSIPVADLGMHVKGRELASELIDALLKAMVERKVQRGMIIDDDE